MQIDTFQAVVGGYFVLLGLVMLIFRKHVGEMHEYWFGALRQFIPLMPSPRAVEIANICFGVLSIIGGGLVVLLALPLD